MKRNTLIVVTVLLFAARAHAIPISWNLPGSGLFQSPASWNPPQIPVTGDQVSFDNGASPLVSFSAVANSASLTVTTGDVTFDLGGMGYFISGNVDIVGLGAPLGPAPLETPVASLAVNAGTLSADGMVSVFSGSALKGNGVVNTPEVRLSGGQLLGTLVVNGNVLNSGTLAPGNQIGSMIINGTYQQTIDATLQIEVAGLTAGSQHDKLSVNGSAVFLAGRLDLPILAGFTPVPNTSITFLQAPNITGGFEFVTAPNLPANVALQIVQLPTGMLGNFVAPTANTYVSSPGAHSWGSTSTWSSGVVPTSTDAVTLTNTGTALQSVNLDTGSLAAKRAFAHTISVSGVTNAMVLGVPDGTSLSALAGITLGQRGRLDLSHGSVYTSTIQVNHGGRLTGGGGIAGSVVVGTGTGPGQSTIDPDFAFGPLFIENNLTLRADAALNVVIQDVDNVDRVIVEESTTLGGRLVMDASNYADPIGTQYNVLVSGQFQSHFDSVETIGSESIFFARIPSQSLAALGPESYTVQSYSIGDMNLDGYVNSADAPDFAMGLVDPLQYWTTHGFMFPVEAGNFHNDLYFDFDDIKDFADAVGSISAADIYELMAQYSVPEPSTCILLLLSCGLLGSRVGRRRFEPHD